MANSHGFPRFYRGFPVQVLDTLLSNKCLPGLPGFAVCFGPGH
jgi:hypothetical protein